MRRVGRLLTSRPAFGKPIAVNQGVSFQIADLAVMETARLLTYRAAWLKDELEAGRRVAEVKQAASIAKLYTSRPPWTRPDRHQVFGGNGFMEEYPCPLLSRREDFEIGEAPDPAHAHRPRPRLAGMSDRVHQDARDRLHRALPPPPGRPSRPPRLEKRTSSMSDRSPCSSTRARSSRTAAMRTDRRRSAR